MKALVTLALLIYSANVLPAEAFDSEMQFSSEFNGGNCGGCAWILAEGVITADTLDDFKAYLESNRPSLLQSGGYNIAFNSPGGNLLGGLRLGRYLREKNWDTYARERSARTLGSPNFYESYSSACYSACVYAFAGGVNRYTEDNALGIHQFYRDDVVSSPENKSLTPTDMANMQELGGLLNEYVDGMGVDRSLVSVASSITPWEPILLLSHDEAHRFNLDTNLPPTDLQNSDWRVMPNSSGSIAVNTQLQNGAGRKATFGLMCVEGTPNLTVVMLSVEDKNINWDLGPSENRTGFDFDLTIDGVPSSLPKNRLFVPYTHSESGADIGFLITDTELGKIMDAKVISAGAFFNMVTLRAIGSLGGTFNMTGSRDVIDLALKNCVP